MKATTSLIGLMGFILMVSLIAMGIYTTVHEIGPYGVWFVAAFIANIVTAIVTGVHENGL
jgi:hypothetical protein